MMKNSIPTIVSGDKTENVANVFSSDLERFQYEEVKDLQLIGQNKHHKFGTTCGKQKKGYEVF